MKNSETLQKIWLTNAKIAELYFELDKDSEQGKTIAKTLGEMFNDYMKALKEETK